MQNKSNNPSFQIDCFNCKKPVIFHLSDLDSVVPVTCPECGKKYALGEETLKRHLKKFAQLCRQIQESEEILGNASIAVDVGPHQVKIPFKILLTRLKSTLDVQAGDQKFTVAFRVEPKNIAKELLQEICDV